jgi:hypothetical protein
VAFAERCEVELFCVHETVTDPDPLPLVGETDSHDPLPDAVQLPPVQPDGEPVIATPCDPAVDVGFVKVGLIEKPVQVAGELPDCVTLNVFPAIMAFAERCEVELFCVHETVTDPDPLPLVGETDNHDPSPDAVQLPPWHPVGDPVIVTFCDPAADMGFVDPGLIEKLVQVGVAGLIVKVTGTSRGVLVAPPALIRMLPL